VTDPHTGAGFDAPTPATAYADAPPLIREISTVLTLTVRLVRPGERTGQAVREQRLRKAAVLDRIALEEAETYAPAVAADAVTTAAAAAHALADYDREHGTSAGPIGPGSPEWDPSHRPYVRQEYHVWHRATRT
jgi:hypothetical protein